MRRLLGSLSSHRNEGVFTFSVVVADNDAAESSRSLVAEIAAESPFPITYCVEPQQNIALARNKALAHASGEFVVFIDDDEYPAENWLNYLFQTCLAYEADGVLGMVKPVFEFEPPTWVRKGGFFSRPTYLTGSRVKWPKTYSGNVLFRRKILDDVETPFRPEFASAGEDVDFFRRMIENGNKFVWCSEAVAYEVIPPKRCTRKYLLKRALLRGSNFPKHPKHRIRNIAKSLIAVPCYTLALPVLAMFGEHVLVRYLDKLLDHVSRLLAFLGLPLMKKRET